MSVRPAKLCDYHVRLDSTPCAKLAIGTCIACQHDACVDHVRARAIVAYAVIPVGAGNVSHLALNEVLKHEMVLCSGCGFRIPPEHDVLPRLIAFGNELSTAIRAQLAAEALKR